VISKLTLDLKHDDLLVVVGSVGAGKTTLLHALMEEINLIEGDMKIVGNIAYSE